MGDVKNTLLGLAVGGVLFPGEPGFRELLQKAIIVPLKIFIIFIMFSFQLLNSVNPIDPSRSTNLKKNDLQNLIWAVLIVV